MFYSTSAPCSVQPRGFRVAKFVATISSETCFTARVATMATCITAWSVNSLPAQGKATGVEASEMLCSSEVAYYVCQFVILWPQCTCISFSERGTTRDYVIMNFDCDGTTNSIKTPVIHFYWYLPFIQFTWIVPLLPTVVQKCTVLTILF